MDYVRNIAAYWTYLVAFIAGALAAYWATLPEGLQTMAIGIGFVIGADILTGSILALSNKKFGSRGAWKGVLKLMAYFSALLLAHGMDVALGLGAVCTAAMLLVLFVMEATSVIENLAKLGLPVPAVIRERLEALRGEMEEAEGNDTVCKP